ncbi:MAG: ribosomal RNA small subunit methyltransferase A [Lentisphaerae bacterium]|nr:ribosomal RNA small subunit methyltransferase A [Lentisphaerota bacterium]
MKLTGPSAVRAFLAEWKVRPQKTLGQNFLVDGNILEIILATAGIKSEDQVLEIGTGLGVLTEPLARAARRVVTVEKDPRMWPLLRQRLQCFPNVELVCQDALKMDLEALLRSGINKVVANLPYSAGSAILVKLLQAQTPPAQLTVMLQQDVALRLTAKPHHKQFGLLALWSQLRYDVAIGKTVSPRCFYPAPAVRSAIINLVRRERPADVTTGEVFSVRGSVFNRPMDDCQDRHFFYALTKFAFARRRKQLKTILSSASITVPAQARPGPSPPRQLALAAEDVRKALQELGIDPRARPEDLSVEMWRSLADALKEVCAEC